MTDQPTGDPAAAQPASPAPAPPPPGGWAATPPPATWGQAPQPAAGAPQPAAQPPAGGWAAAPQPTAPQPAAPVPPAPGWPAGPQPAAPAPTAPASVAWGAPSATPAMPGGPIAWTGAPAVVVRPPGPRGTSGRLSIAVLAVILGILGGANFVNAALPLPADPGTVDPGPAIPQAPQQPETPVETAAPVDPGPVTGGEGIDLGAGYTLVLPDGWSNVGSENGTQMYQKGGVVIIVGSVAWTDSPASLAAAYRDVWFQGGQFQGGQPKTGTIGNAIPAAALDYTGIANGVQLDGGIVAGAVDGDGLLFNVFGASGSLTAVSNDIDLILNTFQHAGR